LLRFKEKGDKEKELPVHHKLEELLAGYLQKRARANPTCAFFRIDLDFMRVGGRIQ